MWGAKLPKPKAILFDLDNCLYPYEPSHIAGMKAVSVKAEKLLGISHNQFETFYKSARDEVKSTLAGTASSHSRLFYFQKLIEKVGLRSQVLHTLDLEQTYWGAYLAAAELFPGVIEFLEEVKIQQIPTALVTDLTAHIQFRKLIYFQIEQFFDYIVTSEEAGKDKPHSKIFEIAAAKLNLSEGPIWMIGEDASKDIQGARNALSAVTFQKIHDGVMQGKGDTKPDVAFHDFQEISAILKASSRKASNF